ncbi:hypothetical protein [Arthrobacter humicola]|jgi:hypothetical protein|uniref:hypothetical protein n=1 Tax=Arthrobacter humicola TaxID=409291 RepID=UPI001FACEE6D|nr:hypothetical protein [Arthrobacter humicola]MCI9870297.1 hypothetical protein [Arthrobacter humicola]
MSPHTVSAQFCFYAAESGGLAAEMTSPTPSLIMIFPPLTEAEEEPVQFGAILDLAGENVRPDSMPEGKLIFWSDLSRLYASKGVAFQIWYDGRFVGEGRVNDIVEDA